MYLKTFLSKLMTLILMLIDYSETQNIGVLIAYPDIKCIVMNVQTVRWISWNFDHSVYSPAFIT